MSFNKKDDAFARRWSKKIRALNFLGGKCVKCGERNIFVLNFHHIDKMEKKANIYKLLTSESGWETLKKEVKKCVVMCRNCHREEHCPVPNKAKQNLLRILETTSCSKCGCTSKSTAVMEFHHEGEKDFAIYHAFNGSDKMVIPIEKVLKEIKNCVMLCSNCHALEHSAIDQFNRLKELIYYKVDNLRIQKLSAADVKKITELYSEGFYGSQIARKLKYGISTVQRVIKNLPRKRKGNKIFYSKHIEIKR